MKNINVILKRDLIEIVVLVMFFVGLFFRVEYLDGVFDVFEVDMYRLSLTFDSFSVG